MAGKPWTKEEIEKFLEKIKTLPDTNAIRDYMATTHRSFNSLEHTLKRYGYPALVEFLPTTRKNQIVRTTEDFSILHSFLKKKGAHTFFNLCDHLNMPPSDCKEYLERARSKGFQVQIENDNLFLKTLTAQVPPPRSLNIKEVSHTVRFGFITDTHYGSLHCEKEGIKSFLEKCEEKKIRHILHAGDITQGVKMFRGWENEAEFKGLTGEIAERQASLACSELPRGFEYSFICGNHDESFLKEIGQDVGQLIASKRKDMVYLGMHVGRVRIGGIDIELRHQESYKANPDAAWAIIGKYPEGEKPHILLLGHTHQYTHCIINGVDVIYGASFESKGTWLKRKNPMPAVAGGVMMTVGVDKKGYPVYLASKFYPI